MVAAELSLAVHVQRMEPAVQGKHKCLKQCGHEMVNCRNQDQIMIQIQYIEQMKRLKTVNAYWVQYAATKCIQN